jgi:hypothetical protein
MLVNLIESLFEMISISNHMKRKVSVIIFICDHHTTVYIILVPFDVCYRPSTVYEVLPVQNYSSYVYCTDRNKGLKQMCSPGTKVSYKIGGCVNKTSK